LVICVLPLPLLDHYDLFNTPERLDVMEVYGTIVGFCKDLRIL